MDSSQLFGITMLAYLLSAAFYLGLLIFKLPRAGQIGMLLAVVGVVVQTGAIGLRWYESYQIGHGHAHLRPAEIDRHDESRVNHQLIGHGGAADMPASAPRFTYPAVILKVAIVDLVPRAA